MKRETSFFKFLRKTNTYLCVRGLTGLPTGSCLYGQNESSFVLDSFHFEQQLVDILHVQILSLKLITKRPQATLNFSLPLENLLSAITLVFLKRFITSQPCNTIVLAERKMKTLSGRQIRTSRPEK